MIGVIKTKSFDSFGFIYSDFLSILLNIIQWLLLILVLHYLNIKLNTA